MQLMCQSSEDNHNILSTWSLTKFMEMQKYKKQRPQATALAWGSEIYQWLARVLAKGPAHRSTTASTKNMNESVSVYSPKASR